MANFTRFTTSPSFATKASHFWRNLKSLCLRGYISNFFEFLNFFKSFHTREAQNDPQWQILPKKWLRLLKIANFGHLQVFPSFPPKSGSDLPWMANHPIHNFSHLLPPQYLIFGEISQIFILGGGTSANFLSFQLFESFTPNWLKMTHNGKFCHQSGLDELKMGNFVKFHKHLISQWNLDRSSPNLQNRPCFSQLDKMSPRSVMLWSKLMKT